MPLINVHRSYVAYARPTMVLGVSQIKTHPHKLYVHLLFMCRCWPSGQMCGFVVMLDQLGSAVKKKNTLTSAT